METKKTSEQTRRPNTKPVTLGRLYITERALEQLDRSDVAAAIGRHARGDWGELDPEDWEQNERSLREGSRLLSTYRDLRGTAFWVITEADRTMTTVLLPEDY
ncbi:MAG: hypothetical protein U0790_02105 [Isosphaeraceae bacterium]